MVDQRASCGPHGAGGIVQTAPVALAPGEPVEMAVFLDGYMLEVFIGKKTVLTALVPGCAFPGSTPSPPPPQPSPLGPPATCVEVAENAKANIGCPAGKVISSVDFASFGAPGGSCAGGGFTHTATCDSNHSMAVVTAACVGKNTCTLDASCATFHEILIGPDAFCWTVAKHLAVKVSCKKSSATLEAAAPPAAFETVLYNSAGSTCDVESWQLAL